MPRTDGAQAYYGVGALFIVCCFTVRRRICQKFTIVCRRHCIIGAYIEARTHSTYCCSYLFCARAWFCFMCLKVFFMLFTFCFSVHRNTRRRFVPVVCRAAPKCAQAEDMFPRGRLRVSARNGPSVRTNTDHYRCFPPRKPQTLSWSC